MKAKDREVASELQDRMTSSVYQKYQQDLYSLKACNDDYNVDQMEEDKLMLGLIQSGVSCHHPNAVKVPNLTTCDRLGQPNLVGPLIPTPGRPSFIFVQPSPTGVWIIQHNLGYNPLARFVGTREQELVGTITYVNNNLLTVTFQELVSGTAFLYPNFS